MRDMATASDMSTPTGGLEFDFEIIDGLGTASEVGDLATARVDSDGLPSVAYGFLEQVNQTDFLRTIRFAQRSSDGTWSIETVVEPGQNEPDDETDLLLRGQGLGFDFVSGEPVVAYLGGDDDAPPPDPADGASDLMVSERSNGVWNERLIANDSNRGEDCSALGIQNYCVQGTVVGFHPALASVGSGFAVAFRDQHFNFADEDFRRADLELIREGPSPLETAVDIARSGGLFNSITRFSGFRVAVAYYLDEPPEDLDNLGIWVAVEGTDGNFTLTQVDSVSTVHRTSIATNPIDGTLWLAYFDRDNEDLVVANSDDEGATWTVERVSEGGSTGLYPSVGFDGQGRVVVAHTFCGPAGDLDCPGGLTDQSEVRIARLESTGWETYMVDDGQGQGFVGEHNGLVVFGPDQRLGVVFRDVRNNDLLFSLEIP